MMPTDPDLHAIPDMAALRAEIDALDAELITRLARRQALIDRAATIKARDGLPARIPERVDEVIANARRHATSAGIDPNLAEALWRQMIEHAIAREDAYLKGDRP